MRTICMLILLTLVAVPVFGEPVVVDGDTLYAYTTENDPEGNRNELAIALFSKDMGFDSVVTEQNQLTQLDHKRHSDEFVCRIVKTTRYAVTDSLVEYGNYLEKVAIRDSVESVDYTYMYPADWRHGDFRTVTIPADSITVELTAGNIGAFMGAETATIEAEKQKNKPQKFQGRVFHRGKAKGFGVDKTTKKAR